MVMHTLSLYFDSIDNFSSLRFECFDAGFENVVYMRVRTSAIPGKNNADALAAESICRQVGRIVMVALRVGSCRVPGIDTGDCRQQDCRISDRACHRSGRILAVRDRDDAAAAVQAKRWLDPDDPDDAGWAHD